MHAARHAIGTITGLHKAYGRLTKAKQNQFHAHLTLLDIHDAPIARDLCLFVLLHDLSQTQDATTKAEIIATIMYMYCGAAMPSYCYNRYLGVPMSTTTNPTH